MSLTLSKFQNDINEVSGVLDALDSQWKELFVYNAMRSQTAQSILTTAKIVELSHQYGSDEAITSIFNSNVIVLVADDIRRFNGYLAEREKAVLQACGDLDGFIAAEDGLDALQIAEAAYGVMRTKGALAPLHEILDKSAERVAETRQDVRRLAGELPHRGCGAPVIPHSFATIDRLLPEAVEKEMLRIRQVAAASASQGKLGPGFLAAAAIARAPLVSPAMSACALRTADGQTYECGGGGASYDNEFSKDTGDPQLDILLSVKDGGFAEDNRRVSLQIDEAEANVRQRINRLSTKTLAIEQALPQWQATNSAFLSANLSTSKQRLNEISAERLEFANANAGALARAKQIVQDFVSSPFDANRVQTFLSDLGGSDFSLPAVPTDAVVPDAPSLDGISVSQRAYGSSQSLTERFIEREQRKVTDQLAANTAGSNLANEELQAADRFAQSGTAKADAFGQDLVHDAASLRFAKSGILSNPSVTIIHPDGTIGRVELRDPSVLPTYSLLADVRNFDTDSSLFKLEDDALRSALRTGGPDQIRRQEVVTTAETVANSAAGFFYSGEVIDAQRMMKFAISILDVGTRWTPGVAWSRDVYEAVTGRDLFSGTTLSDIDRATALLGVVSGGLSDEGVGAVRTIAKMVDLGESAERTEKILDTAKSLDHMAVEMSVEALEREEERHIERDLIDDALDRGSRFWVRDDKTLLSVETGVEIGKDRAAATVDIDKMKVTTVYWESRTDAELAQVKLPLPDGRSRFISLPSK
jgi:hypothetical protein